MIKIIFVCLLLLGLSHGIKLEAPPNWQSRSNLPRGILFQAISPDSGARFRSNLLVSRGPLPCCREEFTSPDTLISKVMSQQERVLPLYKVLEKKRRKFGGRDGGFMVSSYAQGEKDLACFQFFYLDGHEFVNVVYTCLLKDLPRLRPEFEKSLATLNTGGTGDSARAAAKKSTQGEIP